MNRIIDAIKLGHKHGVCCKNIIKIADKHLTKQIKIAKFTLRQEGIPFKRQPNESWNIIQRRASLLDTLLMKSIELKIIKQNIEEICIRTR
jgi:hypothetical protein